MSLLLFVLSVRSYACTHTHTHASELTEHIHMIRAVTLQSLDLKQTLPLMSRLHVLMVRECEVRMKDLLMFLSSVCWTFGEREPRTQRVCCWRWGWGCWRRWGGGVWYVFMCMCVCSPHVHLDYQKNRFCFCVMFRFRHPTGRTDQMSENVLWPS